MLFEKGIIRWWLVFFGGLAVLTAGFAPLLRAALPPEVQGIMTIFILVGMIVLAFGENYGGGLVLALAISLTVGFDPRKTMDFYANTPMIFLALLMIASMTKKTGTFSYRTHGALALYLAGSLISVFYGRVHARELLWVLREILVVVGVLFWLSRHPKRRTLLMDWMLFLSFGLVAVLIYSLVLSPHPGKGAPIPFFPNANYFSAMLSLSLPFLFWMCWTRRDVWRWYGLGVGVLFLVGIIWFQSRGAWVGLLGGLGFFVWFLSRNWRQKAALIAVGVLTLVSAIWFANSQHDAPMATSGTGVALPLPQTDFSSRERLMRWEVAWRLFLEEPLLGVGPQEYARGLKRSLRNRAEVNQISYWYGWNGGAHSEYLTRLAERGLLMLLLFLFYFGSALFYLGRMVKQEKIGRLWAACIAFSLGTWLVHGFFNDLSQNLSLWVGVLVVTGYILEFRRGKGAPTTPKNRNFQASNQVWESV